MVHINNHRITGIYRGLQEIDRVYNGKYIVWIKPIELGIILCCFSNGYWIDEYPWVDTEVWTD